MQAFPGGGGTPHRTQQEEFNNLREKEKVQKHTSSSGSKGSESNNSYTRSLLGLANYYRRFVSH
eukprot:681004-Pelagomonas_calceolata.AAC.1